MPTGGDIELMSLTDSLITFGLVILTPFAVFWGQKVLSYLAFVLEDLLEVVMVAEAGLGDGFEGGEEL